MALARKAVTDAKINADKKIADTAQAAKQAVDELAAVNKALPDVQAADTAAKAALAKAEAAAKEADDKSKALAASKAEADKKLADAQNVSKPVDIEIFPPSAPIVLEVKPAPVALAAAVGNGGTLKRGEKLEIKVTVTRINGFAGPVKLSFPLPPGVAGLAGPEVPVAADKNEAVIPIQAAADATEGQLPNLVIHATADFGGEAAVDLPVAIKVTK